KRRERGTSSGRVLVAVATARQPVATRRDRECRASGPPGRRCRPSGGLALSHLLLGRMADTWPGLALGRSVRLGWTGRGLSLLLDDWPGLGASAIRGPVSGEVFAPARIAHGGVCAQLPQFAVELYSHCVRA